MAKNKTVRTKNSVTTYLEKIADDKRRNDCNTIIELITKQTKLPPMMWGTAIVGFGSYHYKYESGREGDAPLVGLASRSNAIVLYLASHFEQKDKLLNELGKHKTGKGCVYFKKLEDVNVEVLSKMINNSILHIRNQYPN